MKIAEVIAVVSTLIAFLSLALTFMSFRRSEISARQATQERFARMRGQARLMLSEIEAADAQVKQQPLLLIEDLRAVLEKASECGLPHLRDRASELRDGVLQLYRQIENQSQEFQSQLLDLKEMLAAIPTVKATDSDIPQLHNVLDLFEQHRVKVDRRHYEMSSMVSPAREATNTLRKAVGDACEGDSSAGY